MPIMYGKVKAVLKWIIGGYFMFCFISEVNLTFVQHFELGGLRAIAVLLLATKCTGTVIIIIWLEATIKYLLPAG